MAVLECSNLLLDIDSGLHHQPVGPIRIYLEGNLPHMLILEDPPRCNLDRGEPLPFRETPEIELRNDVITSGLLSHRTVRGPPFVKALKTRGVVA